MSLLITLIAAVSDDGYISPGRGVPWDLPEDKAHFRAAAQGKWVLLGHITYEEMIGWFEEDQHPLVLSWNEAYTPPIGQRVGNMEQAIHLTEAAGKPELMVLGGGGAFDAAYEYADRLIITHVHDRLGSGVSFPDFNAAEWESIDRREHPADARHAQAFEIVTYQRIQRLRPAA